LDGSTSGEERAEIIRSFNDPTQPFFLFIMTTKAGGLGLNLQSADTVVLFDLDWNPQNDMQAIARAHRIGQKNEVRVFSLLTKSQFEEKLMRATSRKLQSERIVAAGGFNRMSNAERPETMLRAELMSIFNAETAIFSDQRTTSVFELNEMLARSPKDVAAFKALDKEQPMLDLMGETDVPEWIIKGGDESVQKTEIEMILEAGAGKRVREEKHYNYDLLTLHELEEMLEDGETDMQAMIGKKKEKLAQRKARGGSAPATTAGGEEPPSRGRGRPRGRPRGRGGPAAATAAVAKGRRGKRDSGDEEESVSGEEEEEEMDESMMNEEEAEGEEEDEDLADATTPASGSASASVVSMDPAQFKAKLSSIIDKLLSKTDGSGRRKPANAFKEQLSEIQDRVKAGAYTAPQTFEADVVAVFEAAAGEEGRDAQRAHDGQFLETVFGSLLETEFPDADDDKPESDSGDDDDDDQNEEPQRDDDDDYAEEETPKPARKRGRPPGSGKSSAASASASQRKKRRR
jgi:ATP-dependent helicase STH1/SNF2